MQQQERRQQKVDGISDAVLDSALLLLWHTHGNMRCMYQYLDKVAADMEWRRHRRKLRVVESLSPRVKRPRDRTRVCPETWVTTVENRWSSWSLDDELSVFMADSRRRRILQAVKFGFVARDWSSGCQDKTRRRSQPAAQRSCEPEMLPSGRSCAPHQRPRGSQGERNDSVILNGYADGLAGKACCEDDFELALGSP